MVVGFTTLVVVPNVVDSQYTTNKYSCVLTIYTHITLILLF